ncbi:MAG: YkgJ family cysteine cluster protein [Lachnospiraceae bacterium]|nr:YkgJ family cysteine cluster protein [Lachnospiraceae bacterium]
MYTYNEIKEALLSQISQLLAIEPKWNKCNKCPYSGACCIGADISVYEYEWLIIRDYLLANPDILSTVRKNFNSKSLCYFRTQDKCVIHEIRPLNCIFTPYQVICGADSHLHYTPYTQDCSSLHTISIPKNGFDLSKLYVPLPDYPSSSTTYYLLLNHWYRDYEEKSPVCNTWNNLSGILEPFLNQH